MDLALKKARKALLVTFLAPVVPQLAGSWFNIWYNIAVVIPLLGTPELRSRFRITCAVYNLIAYPIAVFIWWRLVYSLWPGLRALITSSPISEKELSNLRRRLVNLPWWGSLTAATAWLLCIPVFLISLAQAGHELSRLLMWHLPISFLVSAVIAVTHSFFLVELASLWGLYPVYFRDVRPDRVKGALALSLRGRGLLWAVSAGICPIGSLLLLSFAPPAPNTDPVWFSVFVGGIGIAFGICTALMISRLVAQPLDHLRIAAQAVADGRLDVHVPIRRSDEFGVLIEEFNNMIRELRDKERIRQTFGLHVGKRAADQILARDPGLSGVEQVITVMFVDIRAFTKRSAAAPPTETVTLLNEFLRVMVHVVEEEHRGMVNKFLGDGFIALFGIGHGDESHAHADAAFAAGKGMLRALEDLNRGIDESGGERLAIGIGIHTGLAIVGSIGSPQRLEFTAIGNTVNIASRIEGLTKTVGEPLLLTEATRAALRFSVELKSFPAQQVRGVEEPMAVFGPA